MFHFNLHLCTFYQSEELSFIIILYCQLFFCSLPNFTAFVIDIYNIIIQNPHEWQIKSVITSSHKCHSNCVYYFASCFQFYHFSFICVLLWALVLTAHIIYCLRLNWMHQINWETEKMEASKNVTTYIFLKLKNWYFFRSNFRWNYLKNKRKIIWNFFLSRKWRNK